MPISVCIAGTTGWTGSVVARHLLACHGFDLFVEVASPSPFVELAATARSDQLTVDAVFVDEDGTPGLVITRVENRIFGISQARGQTALSFNKLP